jgi:hypothetical protein
VILGEARRRPGRGGRGRLEREAQAGKSHGGVISTVPVSRNGL